MVGKLDESKETLSTVWLYKEKLKTLVEEVYGKKKSKEDLDKYKREIEGMCDNCKTFKLRRNPDRPVVRLTIGNVFNNVVAMDVGKLEGKRFLVVVDMINHY